MTSYRADKPKVDGRTDRQTDRQTDRRTDGGNDITPSAEVLRGKNGYFAVPLITSSKKLNLMNPQILILHSTIVNDG